MYRVLLVDDEPLILAGVKFMIDWSANECELVGVAHNGRQAAELLAELRPDIIIADINMPVMNGIELLRRAREDCTGASFIMLTNLQEFDLLQEAMRLGAVDYLIKSGLDEPSLRQSLKRACQRVLERRQLREADNIMTDREECRRELLCAAAGRLMKGGALTEEQQEALREYGLWDSHSVVELRLPVDGHGADEGRMKWVAELAENLAGTYLGRHVLVHVDQECMRLLHVGGHSEAMVFAEKLSDVTQKVAGVEVILLLCGPFTGGAGEQAVCSQLSGLRTCQYLSGKRILWFGDANDVECRPLGMRGVPPRLSAEINSRRASACAELLESTATRMRETPHERGEMLWLFGELYEAAWKPLGDLPGDHYFAGISGRGEIERLLTLDCALSWLERLKNEIVRLLEPRASASAAFLERARQYVRENLDKRILLQEAAHFACISPSYLSALFKKEYGQSFIDFVNQTKIERACELLLEGRCRVGEVGYLLGFGSADYFSKVFRRHMSMSPSEFLYKQGRQ